MGLGTRNGFKRSLEAFMGNKRYVSEKIRAGTGERRKRGRVFEAWGIERRFDGMSAGHHLWNLEPKTAWEEPPFATEYYCNPYCKNVTRGRMFEWHLREARK